MCKLLYISVNFDHLSLTFFFLFVLYVNTLIHCLYYFCFKLNFDRVIYFKDKFCFSRVKLHLFQISVRVGLLYPIARNLRVLNIPAILK